jgi:hypothetical protein
MASPQAAQALTKELIAWLSERPSLQPDDIVPAFLVTAVKIAARYYLGDNPDELTRKLITLITVACREEIAKREQERDRKIH